MKIKFLYTLPLFFISLQLSAQSLDSFNAYKYVIVSTSKYPGSSADPFGVVSVVNDYFVAKGFTPLPTDTKSAEEILNDPCMALFCSVETKYTDRIAVTLTIKNCKNTIIYSNTGKCDAYFPNLQGNYEKATKRALDKLDNLKYKFNAQLTPKMVYPVVDSVDETEASLKKYFDTGKLSMIEGIYKSYGEEGIGYYKFAIKKKEDKYIAIVLEAGNKVWKTGEVKAVFEKAH